jgi:hypothetical protein
MNVTFEFEKETKGTIRFKEVTAGPLEPNKVGTIYVPKATLKELGYAEGHKLEMALNLK